MKAQYIRAMDAIHAACLFVAGLMDGPDPAVGGAKSARLRSIESYLADLLRKYPPDAGNVLVVVPVPPGVANPLAHGIRTDPDARACAERAGRSG